MPLIPEKPSYISKHGKKVELHITHHARCRFHVRWKLLFPERSLDRAGIDAEISQCFTTASRVKNFSRHERDRMKKHGKDTLYFRTSGFTFVVQASTLVTIEISDDGMRHLNVKPPPTPAARVVARPMPAPAVQTPTPPSVFKLQAVIRDEQGCIRHVHIKSFPSARVNNDEERLCTDPEFNTNVVQRFQQEHPSWQLLSILAKLGKSGAYFRAYAPQTQHEVKTA